MALIIKRKTDLLGTDRHVKTKAYETVRFLLASDGAGLTLTDITLHPGVEEVYGYDNHIEVAYCISGRARLKNLNDGQVDLIVPGTLWAATAHEKFSFVADEPTRLICAFTPAFRGDETGFAEAQ